MVRNLGILAGVLLLLAGGGFGVYSYALRQWESAQIAVKEGRLEDAQKNLQICLFFWPKSVPVHILAARAARLNGDFDQAESHLNQCIKLGKGANDAVQIENLLMRVQRGEEDAVASELLMYVESNHEESPLILETLARAYMRNLRYGPAFVALSQWLTLAPESAEPYRWRAWVLEHLNDSPGAMRDYKKAVELDPTHIETRLRLAEMLLERSNLEEAVPHLEQLQKQAPDRADVKARLGQCRLLQAEPEEARQLMEEAVRDMPNDSALLISLAKLEMQESQKDKTRAVKAEEYIRRALKADPTDTEAQFTLVGILQFEGRDEEANAALDKYKKDTKMLQELSKVLQDEAERPSTDPARLAEVGALFLRTGNDRVGVYWLHRALQRDPRNQTANKALAEYYEGKGDKEKAAEYRRRLSAVQPATTSDDKPVAAPPAK
jgi:tetratricopeptide (TPR) repeat protein